MVGFLSFMGEESRWLTLFQSSFNYKLFDTFLVWLMMANMINEEDEHLNDITFYTKKGSKGNVYNSRNIIKKTMKSNTIFESQNSPSMNQTIALRTIRMPNIIIFFKLQMQKQNYQGFRDEQQTQLPNYQPSIPIGQPVHPNAYPQHPLTHPQQHYMQHPQQFAQQPPQNIPIQHVQPYPQQPFPVAPPQVSQNFNYPIQLQCPCCKMTVPTVVNQQSGNTTYLWCGFLFCFVSPLCCCLPFMMDSCLDKTHYCPNCGHAILRKHQKCFEFIGC